MFVTCRRSSAVLFNRKFLRLASLVLVACALPIDGIAQTVERNASGKSSEDVRIGVYVNVTNECRSGDLPIIRLISAPTNGAVTVKKVKLNATNYKQCLALEVPAYIAVYRSNANFIGTDSVVLEIKYSNGKLETQRISVRIGTINSGRVI